MQIHVLSEKTINRIAAGEVVERPVNVAKELIENAIDAGASAISVEIRDGGVTLLRVTDNGCGIAPSEVPNAFRRHATSKIRDESDLSDLHTLGFRGEALSSIASVSQVEMITKERDAVSGVRAVNTGLVPNNTDVIPLEINEIGAPDGTSVIVRNLFYNVPVRRKFLKTAQTEAGYITDLIEHLALSHPDISFHYRVNGNDKLHTTGNGDVKEIIYRIYGREIARTLLPVKASGENGLTLSGFIGKPEIARGSRSFEVFFVNGRVLESDVLSKGLESGYRTDLMQHQFPFAVLYLVMPPADVDVNVHPSKKEVRFADPKAVYDFLDKTVHETLHGAELIPAAHLESDKEIAERDRAEREQLAAGSHTEPFERAQQPAGNRTESPAPEKAPVYTQEEMAYDRETNSFFSDLRPEQNAREAERRPEIPAAKPVPRQETVFFAAPAAYGVTASGGAVPGADAADGNVTQQEKGADVLADPAGKVTTQETSEDAPVSGGRILSKESAAEYHIVGQFFKTYWMVEYQDKLLLIDQHAAHEKVRYEHLMQIYRNRQKETPPSQMLLPPAVLQLSGKEEACFLENRAVFEAMGYEIEDFGGGALKVCAVPLELYGTDEKTLLKDTLDEMLGRQTPGDPQDILSRIATQSCKAAVKGNMAISRAEAEALIGELLTLDNPYHCPHGRPTMIVLTKQEVERKFRRIV